MKAFAANTILTIVAIVLSLAGAEAILRLADYSAPSWKLLDDELGWKNIPNAEGWFRREGTAYIRMNKAGFNSLHEFVPEKPAGTFRIAIVGDSQVAALQVAQSAHFAAVLERELASCPALAGRSVEVYPFGVQGYNTVQELLLYRNVVAKYHPDVVILGLIVGNDFPENTKAGRGPFTPFARLQDGKLTIDQSELKTEGFRRAMDSVRTRARVINSLRAVQLVKEALVRLPAVVDLFQSGGEATGDTGESPSEPERDSLNPVLGRISASEDRAPSDEQMSVFMALLGELSAGVKQEGARFFVARLDAGSMLRHGGPGGAQSHDPEKRLKALALDRQVSATLAGAGYDVIPTAKALVDAAEAAGTNFYRHEGADFEAGHFNAAAHKVVGTTMAMHLCARLAGG